MKSTREREKEKRSCARENRSRKIVKFDGTKSNLKSFKLKNRESFKRR